MPSRKGCLSKLVLFGEEGLRRAVRAFVERYREERNHQGLDNVLLFPAADHASVATTEPIECKERLGGSLKFYRRRAA